MICEPVSSSELKERYIRAKPWPVCLTTIGSFASRGRTPFTWLTFDSTSVAARSGSALRRRFSVTVDTFCRDVETSVSMPSVLATACSIGVVMKPLIRSALAPG